MKSLTTEFPPLLLLALFGAASLVACGSSDASTPENAATTPTRHADAGAGDARAGATSTGSAQQDDADASTAAPPNEQGCSDTSKLVYVVTQEKTLYRFAPATLTFTKIGTLACATSSSTAKPTSMSVDRSENAWVDYDDGEMFEVSTTDASCTTTGYAPGQHGFTKLGMAFTADGPSTQAESLYVVGIGYANGAFFGKGLATVDMTTMALTPIADFSGDGLAKKAAELTGTGDGKLYGFFATTPATLAEIDKGSGEILSSQPLAGVDVGDAWAFSFWGGDFYFYTAPSLATAPGSTTTVTKLDTKSGRLTVVKKDLGFRVVGAGVSTCVPLTTIP